MTFFNLKMPICSRLWLILLIVISAPASAWIANANGIPNLVLSDDMQPSKLSSLHWADTSQTGTPAKAKVKVLEGTTITGRFSVPLTEANHWFAFSLTNPTNQTLNPSVYVRQVYAHKVNLHYQQQDQWVSQLNGTDIALVQRQENNLEPIFNLFLGPQQSQTFYLEVHTKIKLLPFDIIIGDAKNSHSFNEIHFAAVKIFIGAGLLISLINILMYLSFKDLVYIYYSAYALSFIAATFVINSFDLLLDWQLEDRSFLFLSYHSMIIFISLFISEVLNAKQDMPRINVLLKLCRWLAVAIGVATLFNGNYFSYTLVAFIPASVFFLGILIYASVAGKSSARYLAIGISLFLSGIICVHGSNIGLLPDNVLTEHGGLIGALAEMVFFSMALFRRVLDLNTDMDKANSALLAMSQQARLELEKTVLERTEELSQATQAAEKASEARSEFFATINHEMRTPLNGILGMIEVIDQQHDKIISNNHIKTLKTASHQLSGLINNVLDHSKMNHSKELETQTINFNILDLINELEDIFLNMAKEKKISLILRVADDLSLGRQGDYVKLRQILINLIGNAIKFTHSGQIEFSVSPGPSARDLTFTVTDTGDGIAEHNIEEIFNPYHQVSNGEGQRQSGTGLGLAIAKKLTAIMGGTLDVKSELGKGTQFDLCLSIKPVNFSHKRDDNTNQLIRSIDLSDKCILVADDSAINQQVVEAFLSSSGITLIAVKDGQQALERFKQGDIDIVLMDLHMDLVGGIAATHAIRTFETNNNADHCPIIIHTADTGPDIFQQANQAGADHCLYKPYTQMQLLSILCEFFQLEFDNQDFDAVEVSNMSPLVDKFLEHCTASLEQCHAHIERANFEALGQEVHQMLGSCGVFGATSMSASLKEVEALLNAKKVNDKPLLLLMTTLADQLKMYRKAARLK